MIRRNSGKSLVLLALLVTVLYFFLRFPYRVFFTSSYSFLPFPHFQTFSYIFLFSPISFLPVATFSYSLSNFLSLFTYSTSKTCKT